MYFLFKNNDLMDKNKNQAKSFQFDCFKINKTIKKNFLEYYYNYRF